MATQNSDNDFENAYAVFSLDSSNEIKPIIFTKNLEDAFEKAEKFLTLSQIPNPDYLFYTERRENKVLLFSRQKNQAISYDQVIEVAQILQVPRFPSWDLPYESDSENSDSESEN